MAVYAGENGAKKSYPFGVVNECHEAGKQGPPMPLTRSCLSALNVKGSLRKSICSALHVLNWRHVLAILRIRLICFQLAVRIRGASSLPGWSQGGIRRVFAMYKARLARLVAFIDHAERGHHASS